MDKPKKKEILVNMSSFERKCVIVHNAACDKWEKYHRQCIQNSSTYRRFHLDSLPGEEEILAIVVSKASQSDVYNKKDEKIGNIPLLTDFDGVAEAIFKRIRGRGIVVGYNFKKTDKGE